MKKLMIAAAIVCAAAMSQAAAYTWKTATGSSNSVYVNGTETTYAGATYIFLATDASTVFSTWKAGNDWTSGSLDSSSIANGKIAAKDEKDAFSSSVDPITAIFATEYAGTDGTKYLYISANSEETSCGDLGSNIINFKGNAAISKAAAKNADAGFAGAGWYAQSVPEPTSGLLLLLGVAGLALRRRRA